jgi:tRNA G10  N-methylase Trm11
MEKLKVGDPKICNLNRTQMTFAKRVPKFPPKVAQALLTSARNNCPSLRQVYDPFCGNGTNLLVAGLNFSNQYTACYGVDRNQEAVYSTQINLASILNLPSDLIERRVKQLDSSKEFLPKETKDLVIVMDPPFGRRCELEETTLKDSFRNFYSHGAKEIFFCFDHKTSLPREISSFYKLTEFLNKWDRKFYHAKAR